MLEECHIIIHNKHYRSIILNHKDMNKHKTEQTRIKDVFGRIITIFSKVFPDIVHPSIGFMFTSYR